MSDFKSVFFYDDGELVTKFIVRGAGSEVERRKEIADKLKVSMDRIRLGNPKGHGSRFLKYDVRSLDFTEIKYAKWIHGKFDLSKV